MRTLAVIALSACLSACASTGVPTIKTQTVDVPVATHCQPDLPSAPAYPDTNTALLMLPFPDAASNLRKNPGDLNAAKQVSFNVFYEVRLLAAGRLMRQAREDQLNTAIDGCR